MDSPMVRVLLDREVKKPERQRDLENSKAVPEVMEQNLRWTQWEVREGDANRKYRY